MQAITYECGQVRVLIWTTIDRYCMYLYLLDRNIQIRYGCCRLNSYRDILWRQLTDISAGIRMYSCDCTFTKSREINNGD